LDQAQPVPGAVVIALSEHVDYWDRLGWKDPFSSALFTRRQEAYVRRFRLDSAYTPQMVVDGTTEAVGSDARQVQDAIRQASKADKLHVRISPVFKNSRGVDTVHVEVDSSASSRDESRVMVALARRTRRCPTFYGAKTADANWTTLLLCAASWMWVAWTLAGPSAPRFL
jgi:hypothetical protein